MVTLSFLIALAAASSEPTPCLPRETSLAVAGGTSVEAAFAKLPPVAQPTEAACREVVSGRALQRAGDGVGAAKAFRNAAKTLKVIRPALSVLEAEALVQHKAEGTSAIQRAKRLTKKAPDALRDRVLVAEAEHTKNFGTPKEALAVARRLLKARAGSPEVALVTMADAQRKMGAVREADASLRKLLVEHPEHPLAIERERALDDGTLLLEVEEAADRIQGLIQASRMARAEKEALAFDRKRAPMDHGRIELEVATTQALVRAGRESAAVDHISGLVVAIESDKGRRAVPDEWREARAWALGKAHRFDAAQTAWREISLEAKDEALRTEACFLGGFLAFEVDRFDVAEEEWARCAALLDGHSREVQALWYRALMDLSSHRRERAIKRLRALIKRAPRDKEVAKHRYWLAVALDEGKRAREKNEAKRIWRKLVASGQTDYYAMLSRRRLGIPPPKGTAVAADALVKDAVIPTHIHLLWQLGLDDMARAYARTLGRKRPALSVQQAVGDAHYPWRRGGRLLPYPRVKDGALRPSDGWRASYATPWRPIVDDTIARYKAVDIPASFAYAIMRTESGFLPDAVSIAGALGLLQLMPYTAVGVAKVEGLTPVPPQKLTDPKTNIVLGMHFLARLRREFGATYLAAAAYNGDPRNVADWMRRFEGLDVELFVERVPFKETRNYIKKVTATEAIYRALDGKPLSLDLPRGSVGPPPKAFTAFAFTDDGDALQRKGNDDDDDAR